jgi:hypothetical protein
MSNGHRSRSLSPHVAGVPLPPGSRVATPGVGRLASRAFTPSTTHLAVLGALIGKPEPVTCAELAETTGLTVGQTRRALGDLRREHLASMDVVRATNFWTAI